MTVISMPIANAKYREIRLFIFDNGILILLLALLILFFANLGPLHVIQILDIDVASNEPLRWQFNISGKLILDVGPSPRPDNKLFFF